jgi:hypothetical protein
LLSIKDYNRKKDSAILLIFSIACIALETISYPNYTNAVINNNNTNNSSMCFVSAERSLGFDVDSTQSVDVALILTIKKNVIQY